MASSTSDYSTYAGFSLPDFGAAFGPSGKKSIESGATVYTYNKALFSDKLWQEFVDKYVEILSGAGFSKSSGGSNLTYKKGNDSVELKGVSTSGSVSGPTLKIVIN